MYIPRNISKNLIEAASFYPAIVLTGARQGGKSTMLRKIFPNHNYVSLDEPLVAEEAEQNPEIFLSRYPAPVILESGFELSFMQR